MFQLQEFEKARAIGRRALASINMTCEDDKFNIWMTLLSIENLYGTKVIYFLLHYQHCF